MDGVDSPDYLKWLQLIIQVVKYGPAHVWVNDECTEAYINVMSSWVVSTGEHGALVAERNRLRELFGRIRIPDFWDD